MMLLQVATAQIHVINADSLKLGETEGINGIAFSGNPYFTNIGQADGKIRFMPRSLLFSGSIW